MKKLTMIMAVMFCLGVSMKAQTYVGEIPEEIDGIIPGCFTSSGHPNVVYWVYDEDEAPFFSVYKSDFITHLTDITNINGDNVYYADYIDLDNYSENLELVFTQTLFNNDEFYEYFEYEREYVTYCDTIYSGYDPELDTTYYYVEEYTYSIRKAINVKSTNGNTIWSYNPGEGYTCRLDCVLKFDNVFYLLIQSYNENIGDETYHLYLVKQGQGIAKVDTPLPMSVFPTMLSREQYITVELGEDNNAREITVVNSLGQEVKRIPVGKGQRTITIPARDLSRGLNVLNTRTSKGQGSCKVIVR